MNQSSLLQVAMVDRRSVARPLERGRSRKSGHTCTVCGAVFGLWASLAEHKEVHYNDRRSQQPKPEKRRTPKLKKFLEVQLSNVKEIVPDRIGKNQMIDHLNCSPVTSVASAGLPEPNFSQQNEMRISVRQRSRNSLTNCGSISKQRTELTSNVSRGVVTRLIQMASKHNYRPPLSNDYSDAVIPSRKGRRGCKRKLNDEGKEPITSLSLKHDVVNADKLETSSRTNEKLPNLSGKVLEITNMKFSVMNKNQHVHVESSPDEHESKSNGDGKIDQASNSTKQVSSVSQVEINHCFDESIKKKLKDKAQCLSEKTNCLLKVQNSVSLVTEELPWQTVGHVETVKQNESDGKVCSQMSFTINREELLDVEEEIVCTEGSLEPTFFQNSSRRRKTTPVRRDPPFMISSDTSAKLPTNRNSSGESQLVALVKPEESHTEKPGIQMVSLLKPKQTCQPNTEGGCKGATALTNSLLVQSQTAKSEVTDSIFSPSSQFVLVKKISQKKISQSGLGRPLPPKQMISLLKQHQNQVKITDTDHEENCKDYSRNGYCGVSHLHQSVVGVQMVAPDANVMEVGRPQNTPVSAKERLNVESCSNDLSVISISKCFRSPVISTEFVVSEGSSRVFPQCSPTLSYVSAKCTSELLVDKTVGVPMQHQETNGERKDLIDSGTAAYNNHAIQNHTSYLEIMDKSKFILDIPSGEITPEQPVKDVEPEIMLPLPDNENSFKNSYDCLLCLEKFWNQEELDAHRKSQHLCSMCDRVFRQASNLRKHLRVNHQSYRPHRCETCGKCFPFLSSLKEHWLIHSRSALERVHTCEVCGKAFTRASGLRKHTKEEHLDVKPYMCVLCHKSFAYLCSLRSHMRAHSVERPFRCDACDQRFKQSSNLRKHIRLHHRPKCNQCQGCCICDQQTDKVAACGKSTICEVCGRACEGQKQLTIHMRVHTGEKPEVCDICGKSFQHKSNLLKHQLKHSGTKPFACELCGRAFYANHSLLSHMRLHTGESPFQCDACGKRFCTKNGLQVHALLHSNVRPFACSTCGKTFTQLGNLNKHVALHTGERPFVCAYCDKGFVDSSALKRHAIKHTGKHTLECSTCGKQFHQMSALQSHELLHASELNSENSSQEHKPLMCVVCSKSFMHRSNYVRHMKRHEEMPTELDEVGLNPGEYIVCLTE